MKISEDSPYRTSEPTFISYVEVQGLEWLRTGMALTRGRPWHKETGEARTNFPHEYCGFLERERYQAPAVRRETASRRTLLVSFEDVEASSSLQIVHDHSALRCPYGETLGGHVEVDCWKSMDAR